ncbi:MAG: nucleoside-triphosphatase [Candidatus Nitrosocaldaceae archaeon]
MLILITGDPGVGKTTVLINLINILKHRYRVGGVIAREIRSNNSRIGFEFIDIVSNERRVLASIDGIGPMVGKYHVNLEGCKFAANILSKEYEIIICDELGPMEFKSREFKDVVRMLLYSNADRIFSIHKRLKDPLIEEYRERADMLIEVRLDNRDKVAEVIDKLIRKERGI